MSFVYVLLPDGAEWEDLVILLTEQEAINASIKYPNFRVSIFTKKHDVIGYHPTYDYYKNGTLVIYSS